MRTLRERGSKDEPKDNTNRAGCTLPPSRRSLILLRLCALLSSLLNQSHCTYRPLSNTTATHARHRYRLAIDPVRMRMRMRLDIDRAPCELPLYM